MSEEPFLLCPAESSVPGEDVLPPSLKYLVKSWPFLFSELDDGLCSCGTALGSQLFGHIHNPLCTTWRCQFVLCQCHVGNNVSLLKQPNVSFMVYLQLLSLGAATTKTWR